ncbi:MAG: V-type ATP synthase subunit D [Candidatus Hodarchaeales archaeon]|jgi:V/A-type H+-transporting ATPase subunit D
MAAEKLDVHPTRLELLRLKRRKALAEGVGDILQKDLETLIVALIEHAQRVQAIRTNLQESLNAAYSLFIESEMLTGTMKVSEIALSAEPIDFKVGVNTTAGVLGIEFPEFQLAKKETGTTKPRFNLSDTPIQLDESASKSEEALKFIVSLAEITAVIREMLEIIAVKRRQINRIRFKIIPQIDATIRYVELILEEIERQDAIRVRVLQRKRKERAVK